MCGRFNLIAKPEQLKQTFQLAKQPRYQSSYNIPPGQKILTIVELDNGNTKAVNLHWGLIPHWSKEQKISAHLINARAETLTEKPSFREAYKKRRCLIPATGYYEWQKFENRKQAYSISLENYELFAFAGLWEYWQQAEKNIYSCTIITTAANAFMQSIHPRMPVIVDKANYRNWLDKNAAVESLQQTIATSAYKDMRLQPISNWVNSPQHDDENCLN